MTRARAVCGGIELPLIPLSLVDGTESRPMVEIASIRKHKDRPDLPIGISSYLLAGILHEPRESGVCLSKAIALDLTKAAHMRPGGTCNLDSGKRLYTPHTKTANVQAPLCRYRVRAREAENR